MKVLIIEDDEDKLSSLRKFLDSEFPGIVIEVAHSFGSGLRAIIAQHRTLDLVLLDMSMPNFDVSVEEPSGGNPEPFAGRELLAQMKLRGIGTPSVVVTMFDSFGDKRLSLSELILELSAKYSPPYQGTIHYDSRQEGWRSALRDKIRALSRGAR